MNSTTTHSSTTHLLLSFVCECVCTFFVAQRNIPLQLEAKPCAYNPASWETEAGGLLRPGVQGCCGLCWAGVFPSSASIWESTGSWGPPGCLRKFLYVCKYVYVYTSRSQPSVGSDRQDWEFDANAEVCYFQVLYPELQLNFILSDKCVCVCTDIDKRLQTTDAQNIRKQYLS